MTHRTTHTMTHRSTHTMSHTTTTTTNREHHAEFLAGDHGSVIEGHRFFDEIKSLRESSQPNLKESALDENQLIVLRDLVEPWK